MTTETPTKVVVNCTTGVTEIIPLTAEEISQREADAAAYAAQKAIDDAIFAYYKKLPLEEKSKVLGFYKERSARGFKGV